MRVRISPGARKVNQTGVRARPLSEARLTTVGFEYPAFLVKTKKIRIHILKWITGYLAVATILLVMEIAVGHSKWGIWSYITWGYIIAWVIASITGEVKGWFYR